tara:strand:- start:2027 stop:2953 length:927 start_codon:yes stop_codon:yes gene_type:complete
MDVLKKELLDIDDFNEIVRKMMSPEIINLAKNFLSSLHAISILNTKDFLTAFMIYKYPEDTVGSYNVPENKQLIDASRLLINCHENEIKKYIVKYGIHFKTWKNKDLKTMKEQLFNEYHQLSVDIANTEDNDKKHVFETTKNEVMKVAKNIGGENFVNEIKSFAPVLINQEQLENQYNKAFFDVFCQEFNEKKYTRFESLLQFIKNTLLQLNNNTNRNHIEEYIDIEFIIQRFKYDLFNDEELERLCNFIYEMVKNVQSASRDKELEEFKEELKNKPIYFPSVLFNVVHLIRMVVIDLENLKSGTVNP